MSAAAHAVSDCTTSSAPASVSRPIFVIASTALMVVRSINSTSEGSATASMAITAFPAASVVAKKATSVAGEWGGGRRRTITSTMTASVPSDPTSSFVRSSPATFLRHGLPVLITDPSASTARSAATWSPVTQHAPPAFVATFPPIEQMARLDGSGAYQRPSAATAAAKSPFRTPGSTVAVR